MSGDFAARAALANAELERQRRLQEEERLRRQEALRLQRLQEEEERRRRAIEAQPQKLRDLSQIHLADQPASAGPQPEPLNPEATLEAIERIFSALSQEASPSLQARLPSAGRIRDLRRQPGQTRVGDATRLLRELEALQQESQRATASTARRAQAVRQESVVLADFAQATFDDPLLVTDRIEGSAQLIEGLRQLQGELLPPDAADRLSSLKRSAQQLLALAHETALARRSRRVIQQALEEELEAMGYAVVSIAGEDEERMYFSTPHEEPELVRFRLDGKGALRGTFCERGDPQGASRQTPREELEEKCNGFCQDLDVLVGRLEDRGVIVEESARLAPQETDFPVVVIRGSARATDSQRHQHRDQPERKRTK